MFQLDPFVYKTLKIFVRVLPQLSEISLLIREKNQQVQGENLPTTSLCTSFYL